MRRETVLLVDDISGKEADETITFGLDRSLYEIDLGKRNADKLRRVLAPYILAGRRVGRSTRVAR